MLKRCAYILTLPALQVIEKMISNKSTLAYYTDRLEHTRHIREENT
jgi:hypothetical protein